MGFKEDADFARFVSMGAVGSAAVANDLTQRHGHRPIELERYAMSNKVWQTKVKRLRMPDLVCTACGLRVESRAKSKLGIVLSHSEAVGRGWDGGGMRDNDLYAFLRADMSVFPPRVSSPWYFATESLRESLDFARLSDRKAASEGSEVTLTWPTWVPAKSGRLVGVDEDGRLVCEWTDGSVYRYWQWHRWGERRYQYADVGEEITAHETMVAGVVAPPPVIACPGDVWDVESSLGSHDATDRYSAIKTIGALRRTDLVRSLVDVVDHEKDWRIRLEALGSLALIEPDTWTGGIADIALDPELSDEVRIEATFLLSELSTSEALDALETIGSSKTLVPSEIRAAATWGLGQGFVARPDALLQFLDDEDFLVRLHALAAIDDIPTTVAETLRTWLSEHDPVKAAAAAALLQRHNLVEPLVDAYEEGGVGRLWAVRALGGLAEGFVRSVAGGRLTEELEKALLPLWLGRDDWIESEGQEGLDALGVQKVRSDPYDFSR